MDGLVSPVHHRFPGSFFIIRLSPFGNEKSPCSPEGTRTEKTLSAVPPCLPVKPTALPAPTRRLPGNAGNASEDTWDCARSLCPRRPICCSAFRFPLSYGKLSVDALAALLPRRWFVYQVTLFIHHPIPFVKHYFSRGTDKCAHRSVSIPGPRPGPRR